MANKVFRVIIGIIVACGLLVGLFFVLPGRIKNPVMQGIQETFMSQTAVIANTYKNMKVPENEMTFDQMLKGSTSGASWVVKTIQADKTTGTGTYEVHAYGYKVTISMAKENGEEKLKTYTDRDVEIVFYTTKSADGKVSNTGYKLFIYDEEQNEWYRQQALNCLCSLAAGQ